MPNPYVHNKAGRAAAWKCGCDECIAAVTEYEGAMDAIAARGWDKIGNAFKQYEEEIRRQVYAELGFCPVDKEPMPCMTCGAGL
jgi:hypothetical protein